MSKGKLDRTKIKELENRIKYLEEFYNNHLVRLHKISSPDYK